MKILGIIAIILGIFFLIPGIGGLKEYPEQAGRALGFGISLIAIGVYLIYNDNQVKKSKKDRDKWINNS